MLGVLKPTEPKATRMSDATPVLPWSDLLLALPEFDLLHAEVINDELIVTVELPRDVQACPSCGTIELHRVHDRRWHRLRHLPVAGRACRLVWHKRLLSCVEGCGTFVERTPSVMPGSVWTRPAARAAVAMSAENIPVDTIRKKFGVGWNTVMRAVTAAAAMLVSCSPTRVGIDETVFTSGRLLTRRRVYTTGLVCLDCTSVVGVAKGRDKAVAGRLLADHAPDAIVVTCDLFSGFKAAAADTDATVVADVFHVVRLAVRMIDQVRRRRQNAIHGHRGRKGDWLYDHRAVLRVGQERLDQDKIDRLAQGLLEVDTESEVGAAWHAADLLRRVYRAADRDTAHRRLIDFYWWAAAVNVPEITTFAQTLNQWQEEVLAYFDTRATNGPTESANVKIKNIRRAARGFSNFDNFQARIKLHAGQPRSVPTTPRLRSYTTPIAA